MMIIQRERMMPAPYIRGDYGDAWQIDCDLARRNAGRTPMDEASVAQFLIHSPGHQPGYDAYTALAVHLRLPQAYKSNPKATHAIYVFSVDSGSDFKGALTDPRLLTLCDPPDVQFQITAPCDAYALCLLEGIVRDICYGWMTPCAPAEGWRQWLSEFPCAWKGGLNEQ